MSKLRRSNKARSSDPYDVGFFAYLPVIVVACLAMIVGAYFGFHAIKSLVTHVIRLIP